MLVYSMTVSVDGFINDPAGELTWSAPSEEVFRFHLDRTRELGGFLCGRRVHEAMLVWETDPAMRSDELTTAFADVWCALPKVVFSRTLDHVEGNARLAERPLADEVSALAASTEEDIAIGGATLAAQAVEQGLVEDLRAFRYPIALGGGTPFLPPVPLGLDLAETRSFDTGVVYERYRVRPASPAGSAS
ncbi:dihydrofolate reductase family protein [Saccharopolyspora sp. TS4A08]|uniref:Dihydrofolate reductase family protein n=1 Tax=Saccharopolyspora ipomoeae TaxID=3042027 RepID=A0ABT6PIM0_9PSEU|nr:dihydrofolate reductase family protein [Saccharopolyspora sp. TS4A08]MDI2027488.1 dihydrofolate reductase family protein [Saccharopolyspora sp. TS4A08]